jgi:putative PIN family toxin of toxin-antitoxin system
LHGKAGKFTLIVSHDIASEYHAVLKRPKFRIAQTELDDFFALLLNKAEFVSPSDTVSIIIADPTDNKFLEAALEGKADLIVSGDTHLLDLKVFHEIPILTVREFISRLEY